MHRLLREFLLISPDFYSREGVDGFDGATWRDGTWDQLGAVKSTSIVDIGLIFELLHAVASCGPMNATEYGSARSHTSEQIMRGFGVLHQHRLLTSSLVTDDTGYRISDYKGCFLTDKGRQVHRVMLQTQLSPTKSEHSKNLDDACFLHLHRPRPR